MELEEVTEVEKVTEVEEVTEMEEVTEVDEESFIISLGSNLAAYASALRAELAAPASYATTAEITQVSALRVRKKMSPDGVISTVGDVLCENIPTLTPYIRFCAAQLNAASFLQMKTQANAEFQEAVKRCQSSPAVKGMPLSAFMLKPMQRITRYPLLIEKIVQATPPEHPDNSNIKEALNKAVELCNQVNEGVRERENSDQLEWMQRNIKLDGLSQKLTFNALTNMMGSRKFIYCAPLVLSQLEVQGGQTEPTAFSLRIPASSSDERHEPQLSATIALRAPSQKDRDAWVSQIQKAIAAYAEAEKSWFFRQRSKIQAVDTSEPAGRILVVILEACDLAQSGEGSGDRVDPYCEVSMGSQINRTSVVIGNRNPKWNASMQFIVKDIEQDVLCLTVYGKDDFAPNAFLGRTEVRVSELKVKHTGGGPLLQKLRLHEVQSGELHLKMDLQLFNDRRIAGRRS
ncbi:unnamed protein product [Cyprideis torosa]|uniref:Uncharacterized protein n=1 Tax=Cyprideis torosa TaxID=163714 RepID=A0A7R8ZMB8_9CRUS|nr:unnamed protein product [Cyprideis torosa]CAG0885444.1 unnamed protein product [Cyprideis torosa]